MASTNRPRTLGGWLLDDSLADIHHVLCCRIVSVRDPKKDFIHFVSSEPKYCLALLNIPTEPRTCSVGHVWLHNIVLSLFSSVDALG